MSDPRIFFAAERTLLAWVRSGITLMALGFVVAKFGMFLTLLEVSSSVGKSMHQNHLLSNFLGITLILIGLVIILGAQYNHRCYVKTLPTDDLPTLAITWLTSFLSLSIFIAGIMLSLYLALA